MSSVIYNETNPLPETGVEEVDLAVIDYDIEAAPVAAVSAVNVGHLVIGKNRAISGDQWGLYLVGPAITVTNEGTIQAQSNGISLFASGALTVFNVGSVVSWDVAILGGTSHDRIINTGTLETKYSDPGPVVMDLRDGDDFYDGILGTVIGGAIWLGSGNDTAYGGAGSEIFVGGAGNDFLYGGGGIDTADYSEATGFLYIDLNRTGGQNLGSQGTDTLIDIENLVGGAFNDTFIGNAADNTFQGRDGNDELVGGLGNDSLEGGEGNDTLDGGSGNDVLIGGNGTNTARYLSSTPATVDLGITDVQNTGGYGWDTLTSIVNLIGGSGADIFIGNSQNNEFVGNAGNDILTGGGGNDTLKGGAGEDMAVFSGSSGEYERVTTTNGFTITHVRGTQADGTDTLESVRLVKFLGDDKIIALTNSNPTYAGSPSMVVSESKKAGDTFAYLSSSDSDGDDVTYSLDSVSSNLFGVRNEDDRWEIYLKKAVDYEQVTQHKITITLQDPYDGSSTKAVTVYVQNVVESTPLVRRGTSKGEPLTGESGSDKLSGLGSNDTLYGQIGNDTLIGGTGNDTLFGGAGKDVFVFDQKPSAKSNLDYIYDFSPKDDVIHLSRSDFTKIAKGTLSSKAFVVGNQFKDKDDRILHLKDAGALFYDPDGTGSAKAIQFANLGKNLKLTYKDFYII